MTKDKVLARLALALAFNSVLFTWARAGEGPKDGNSFTNGVGMQMV